MTLRIGMLLVLLLGAISLGARAEPFYVDCTSISQAVASIAYSRDTGAELELTLALIRERYPNASRAALALFEREVQRMWREKLPADDARQALYERCISQAGDMGESS